MIQTRRPLARADLRHRLLENFSCDLARFADREKGSRWRRLAIVATTQGVWAVAVYRFGRWVHTRSPRGARLPLKVAYHVAQKAVEVTTGIQIPASCVIGPGLYIGHFGAVLVHGEVRMGSDCSLSQDTTIGTAGLGRAGAPVLGDGVYVAAGARVLGPIQIGDRAVVGANAVVLCDVPAEATAVGVPARVIVRARRDDSADPVTTVRVAPGLARAGSRSTE